MILGLNTNKDPYILYLLLIFFSVFFIFIFIVSFEKSIDDIYYKYNIFIKKNLPQLLKLIKSEDIQKILENSSVKSLEYELEYEHILEKEEIDEIIKKEFLDSPNNRSYIRYSDLIKIVMVKENIDKAIYIVTFSKFSFRKVYTRYSSYTGIKNDNNYLALIIKNNKIIKNFYQDVKTKILKKEKPEYTIIYKILIGHSLLGNSEIKWIYFSLWKKFSLDYVKEILFKNLSEIKELIKTVCIE